MKFLTIMVTALLVMAGPWLAQATTHHAITVDANTSDFDADELVWADSQSDCYWNYNELYNMYITWDSTYLYIGADFLIEEANSLSWYFDFGYGEGAHDLSTVSWEKFFYTQGWQGNFSVNVSGDATNGIFRIYGDYSDEEWTNNPNIMKQINLQAGMYECAIAWSVIYPGGMPPGATMGAVCTLTGYRGYDGADAMPNQTIDPNGDGQFDTLDVLYNLDLDHNMDGQPDTGWHPNTNSGASGQPPQASAYAEPTSGPAPLTVNFEGVGMDPDGGSIVSFDWTFGDGGTSQEQNPTHVYTTAGSYTATLVVTDDENDTDDDSVVINVTGAGMIALEFTLPKEQPICFQSGDYFDLKARFNNPGATASGDFYCVLDVYGAYFFYPLWTEDLQNEAVTVAAGISTKDLLAFTWPDGAGAAQNILFYGLLTTTGTFDMASNLALVTFCFE